MGAGFDQQLSQVGDKDKNSEKKVCAQGRI